MKKIGQILCLVLIVALIVAMIISNNTHASGLAVKAKSQVTSGENFDVVVEFDTAITAMQFHLAYDTELFTYNQGGGKGWTIGSDNNGEIACMFITTATDGTPEKAKATFKFTAKNVDETKTGDIKVLADDNFAVQVDKDTFYDKADDLTGNFKTTIQVSKAVEPVIEQKPQLSTTAVSLKVGEITNISITNRVTATWTSSNPSIATVDQNGNITGIEEGETSITASNEGGTATVSVTVKKNSSTIETGPVLSKNSVSLKVGESEKITADKPVSWISDNENVAKVEQDGTIIAVAKGTATIIAKDGNGRESKVSVEVSESPSNVGNNNGSNPVPGTTGGSSTNPSSGAGSSSGSISKTKPVQTASGSSAAQTSVPATGESSVGTITMLVAITLIFATIIFRRKSKLR